MEQLKISEDLTIYNISTLLASLSDLLDKSQVLEIDLSMVSEIDTSGVQLLVHLKNKSLRNNKKLSFKNHSEQVVEAFEMYNISSFFDDPILISAKR